MPPTFEKYLPKVLVNSYFLTKLLVLYFSIWIESKPIVWDSSCSITENLD